jgi:hypothetical protein
MRRRAPGLLCPQRVKHRWAATRRWRAQADPVPIPRPQIQAGEHPNNKAKLAVTSKAPPIECSV